MNSPGFPKFNFWINLHWKFSSVLVQTVMLSPCDALIDDLPLYIPKTWSPANVSSLEISTPYENIIYEENGLAYDPTTASQIILTCASLLIYCCHSWGLMVVINHPIWRRRRKPSSHAQDGGNIIYLLALTYNKNNFSVDLSSHTQMTMSSHEWFARLWRHDKTSRQWQPRVLSHNPSSDE